jgi:hypothetical protein
MRSKGTPADQPKLLRRKNTPAPWTAWLYRSFSPKCSRTEIPLCLDRISAKRSWLKGKLKPSPWETEQRPVPLSER